VQAFLLCLEKPFSSVFGLKSFCLFLNVSKTCGIFCKACSLSFSFYRKRSFFCVKGEAQEKLGRKEK